MRCLFGFALIASLAGCAHVRVPTRDPNPDASMIGISVRVRLPLRLVSVTADGAFLVPVGDGAPKTVLIRSNYSNDGRVYFLNVKPGRYAAVASYSNIQRQEGRQAEDGHTYFVRTATVDTQTTVFAGSLVTLTEVVVPPGEFAFMGDYVIDAYLWKKERADEAQAHHGSLIASGDQGGWVVVQEVYFLGAANQAARDRQTELRFLEKARRDLRRTDWRDFIQRRIEAR